MTKTTTGSSRLTVILSWVIALVCLVGGALFIWLMPSPGQGAIEAVGSIGQEKFGRSAS